MTCREGLADLLKKGLHAIEIWESPSKNLGDLKKRSVASMVDGKPGVGLVILSWTKKIHVYGSMTLRIGTIGHGREAGNKA